MLKDEDDDVCQPLLYPPDHPVSPAAPATIKPGYGQEQSKARNRWITIEPIVFLTFIGNGTFSTIRTEYLQHRIGMDTYNYTFSNESATTTCITNSSDPDYVLQQEIQQEASSWILYISICNYLPLLFTSILFGTWSDTAGRKIALVVSLIGMVLQTTMYLIVISLRLPIPLLLIGDFVAGITGNVPLLLVACLAYIADITTREQRTFRVVILETTLLVSIGGAQLFMGYFIHAKGFVAPFFLILACLGAATAYALIPGVLYETIMPPEELSSQPKRSRFIQVLHGVIDLFTYNVNARRWRLIMICVIFLCLNLVLYGYVSVFTLYVIGEPFCWSTVLVGIWQAISLSLSAIANVAGAKLFGLCLSDISMLHISWLSHIVAWVMLGLAKQTVFVFAVAVIGCLKSISIPMMRAMASKSVFANEQGVMLSVLATMESLGTFFAPILFQPIYAATVVHGMPGAPFLLAAGLAVLGAILTVALHCTCWSSAAYDGIPIDTKIN